jgi:hypothetical protein
LQKQFNKQLPELFKFFDQNFDGWRDSKVLQIAFVRLMMGVLHKQVSEWAPPSLSAMINHMGNMPTAFDSAFPDYRAAGMGRVILDKLRGSK